MVRSEQYWSYQVNSKNIQNECHIGTLALNVAEFQTMDYGQEWTLLELSNYQENNPTPEREGN